MLSIRAYPRRLARFEDVLAGAKALMNDVGGRRAATGSALAAIVMLLLASGFLFSAPGAFSPDELMYRLMTASFAEEGRLTIQQMHLDGAPALDFTLANASADGRINPQYPSGYAIVSAPFYALFGVRGMMLVNALSAGATLLLTFRIARRLGASANEAMIAVGVLGAATYFSVYAFALWPHMLSAALTLGVVYATLLSAREDGARRAPFALLAGLIGGFAITIRVEMIFFALASLLWLRLFVVERTRLTALAFALGLLPGFLAASILNGLKFGEFLPLSYGELAGRSSLSFYGGAFLALGGVLVLLFAVNVRRLAPKPGAMKWLVIAGTAGAAALLLFFAPASTTLRGAYTLLVDLQAIDLGVRPEGAASNEAGVLIFFGVIKKALLQSAPIAILTAISAWMFLRGKARYGTGLLLLCIGAPVAFYSMSHWHGGLAFNMRYLTPVLPLGAILIAEGFCRLAREAGAVSRRALFICGAAGFLLFGAIWAVSLSVAPASARLLLYPQLALAAGLAVLIALYLARPVAARARNALLAATATLGASLLINLSDFIQDQTYRSRSYALERWFDEALPEGALLLTDRPVFLGRAMRDGLSVVYAGADTPENTRAAIAAFRHAGRCVFVHGEKAAGWLTEKAAVPLATLEANGPAGALLTTKTGSQSCLGETRLTQLTRR